VSLSHYSVATPVSRGEPNIMCSENDLKRTFRFSKDESDYLWTILQTAIITGAPDSDGTNTSFHSFWGNKIRKIIVAIFTPYEFISWGTSTALRRPGFGVLPQGVSVFKGQEKPLESILKTSYLTYWRGRMIPHPGFLVSISMCHYTASY
jgi:hypothetical protein